jgi:hypothetical protein
MIGNMKVASIAQCHKDYKHLGIRRLGDSACRRERTVRLLNISECASIIATQTRNLKLHGPGLPK